MSFQGCASRTPLPGAARIGKYTELATKPELAQQMIERAVMAWLPFSWFIADEAYGDNGPLRDLLEQNKIPFVIAVTCDDRVTAGPGRTIRGDALAGEGSGPRLAVHLVRAGVERRAGMTGRRPMRALRGITY